MPLVRERTRTADEEHHREEEGRPGEGLRIGGSVQSLDQPFRLRFRCHLVLAIAAVEEAAGQIRDLRV